jgi:hypothetical protein
MASTESRALAGGSRRPAPGRVTAPLHRQRRGTIPRGHAAVHAFRAVALPRRRCGRRPGNVPPSTVRRRGRSPARWAAVTATGRRRAQTRVPRASPRGPARTLVTSRWPSSASRTHRCPRRAPSLARPSRSRWASPDDPGPQARRPTRRRPSRCTTRGFTPPRRAGPRARRRRGVASVPPPVHPPAHRAGLQPAPACRLPAADACLAVRGDRAPRRPGHGGSRRGVFAGAAGFPGAAPRGHPARRPGRHADLPAEAPARARRRRRRAPAHPTAPGGRHGPVPARPGWTPPRLRCLGVAPPLGMGLPPAPTARGRPCPAPRLRLRFHLARGLPPRELCAMSGTHGSRISRARLVARRLHARVRSGKSRYLRPSCRLMSSQRLSFTSEWRGTGAFLPVRGFA